MCMKILATETRRRGGLWGWGIGDEVRGNLAEGVGRLLPDIGIRMIEGFDQQRKAGVGASLVIGHAENCAYNFGAIKSIWVREGSPKHRKCRLTDTSERGEGIVRTARTAKRAAITRQEFEVGDGAGRIGPQIANRLARIAGIVKGVHKPRADRLVLSHEIGKLTIQPNSPLSRVGLHSFDQGRHGIGADFQNGGVSFACGCSRRSILAAIKPFTQGTAIVFWLPGWPQRDEAHCCHDQQSKEDQNFASIPHHARMMEVSGV